MMSNRRFSYRVESMKSFMINKEFHRVAMKHQKSTNRNWMRSLKKTVKIKKKWNYRKVLSFRMGRKQDNRKEILERSSLKAMKNNWMTLMKDKMNRYMKNKPIWILHLLITTTMISLTKIQQTWWIPWCITTFHSRTLWGTNFLTRCTTLNSHNTSQWWAIKWITCNNSNSSTMIWWITSHFAVCKRSGASIETRTTRWIGITTINLCLQERNLMKQRENN